MNKTMILSVLGGSFLLTASAVDIPGVPRDSNFNNTGGYDSTRVEARFNINLDGNPPKVIHFIRDNNDPRVITKTYLLQNVDPYEFRDYLRQMVQSKRVGNTSLQQQYPGNTSVQPLTATTSSPMLSPTTSQPSYNPSAQLGSNTAVECLKYVDGTGLLIVSAEEYRFKDNENGMGIDSLVAALDKPSLGPLGYGSQMFIYMPKFVPARNLQPLIENVGMNINDVTELWQGVDIVATDPDLNWLVFDVANYSCANIANMLAKFDVPIPQVRLKIQVYEITSENDDRIGIDFQSWKNNEGTQLFSVGGRYRNNWDAIYSPNMMSKAFGSERTSFYNFNPKWNTRYIDFLASRGKAKVVHSGELCIRNNNAASLSRMTQIIYMDDSKPAPRAVTPGSTPASTTTQTITTGTANNNTVTTLTSSGSATTIPNYGVGNYQLLSNIIGAVSDIGDALGVGKGNQQITTVSGTQFGFSLTVNNASVNLEETRFNVTLSNTSLLGFQSSGAPRISKGNVVTQSVSLPHGKDSFIIGGLRKQETVTSKTGVPWLMDIPYAGYLFSTVSTSVKHAELIVVAQCEWDSPADSPAVSMSKKHSR